ncbi:alpha/beta hydrolase [Rhizobium sp. TRM95001]|nr:alpha/beta hydrolase [Rhizobium halophilum]
MNRFLRFMPRYRTERRYNARLIQALLRVWDRLPGRDSSGPDLRIEDRQVAMGVRPVRLRLIVPRDRPRGIYLTFHGGAWVMGTPRLDDPINTRIARECQVVVVSVDHHLAQDDRLDLAIADARRAAEWTAGTAAAFGAERIIVGGQSSGAHLAACALLHLRALQPAIRLAGAVLFYGAYDMAGSPGLRQSSPKTLLIDGQAAYRNLLRLTPGLTDQERRAPRLSPLYADLGELPPALFIAGELDPVFDDRVRMAERWNEANGNAELVRVPQGLHGFDRLPLSMGVKVHCHVREKLREWLED